MTTLSVQEIINNNADKVIFFSKQGCFLCDKLALQLDIVKVPFTVYKLETSQEIADLVAVTNYKMFPQLFFGQSFVGGLSEFERLCSTCQLEEKLKPLGITPELDF